ncbi:hypothetical protein N7456_004399 [Penicillium angulare]|uniref:Uncharacterized protein n=1 Tax=Penicillium angulare TaxID=116970 RepID=A0A9W9FWH5_9EURO|nr:hypothetical protein N7456_004399 [Penicillium angulare]
MKAGSQNTVLTSSAISAVESSSTSGKDQYDPVLHGSDSNAVDSLRRGRTSTVTSTPATTSSVCSFDIAELTALQSEEYLAHFLTFKLQYFPFIRIPLEMSSEQLRIERPFLWPCIMSISTKSTAQQNEISLNVRQIVAQEMVVKSEKSIDLLLGILGFIGW